MNDSSRLEKLLTSLGMEISLARAGSPEGQFPILDILGNLRTEAGKVPALAAMRTACQTAWDQMALIVESGRSFSEEEILWLKKLSEQLNEFVEPTSAETSAAGKFAEIEREMVINLSLDSDLLRDFAAESREHLDNIEKGVLVLENHPSDSDTLNNVFRAFHTFKGGAGFLHLSPISDLSHVMESLLDLARDGKLPINDAVIDLILRGRDTLKQFMDEIDAQLSGAKPPQPINIPAAALKTEVRAHIESICPGTFLAAKAPVPPPLPAPVVAAQKTTGARPENNTIVKVDTGKLDALLDLVGEMVIAQSLITRDINNIPGVSAQVGRNLGQLSRITKELQRLSMSMRMLPIRGAFQKMARVVRDLGSRQGKKVQLLTDGEDTELDRNLVEQLNDPLLHMIRNSMDHGIELPEARVAKGKPAIGSIHLGACHQGGNIVIEIRDDGSGLDRNRIMAKAVERGLAKRGAELLEEDVFAFIFHPGFSTAETLTDLSGRGVGLDVVKKNIEQLRGCITVTSSPGKGTHFKITLPLTLAIIDGLVVKVGGEQYIVPSGSVVESFRPAAGMISSVNRIGEVVNLRGRLIPLLRLYERFGVTPASTDPTESIAIVVEAGMNTRCLLVDALIAKQEVVIKNLNDLMAHKNRHLAGAAILGDGRVGLILDVNSLVFLESPGYPKAA